MEAASSSSSSLFHYSSPSDNSPTASTQNAAVFSGAAASPSLDSSDYPPSLRLKLNITEELIKKIENVINPQQHKSPEKKKTALNFPIARITIGQWTRELLNPNDLRAKFYFARKKLLWQFLDVAETEQGGVEKLHRKIEMDWDDVLSLRTCFYSHDDDDQTEILEVEVRDINLILLMEFCKKFWRSLCPTIASGLNSLTSHSQRYQDLFVSISATEIATTCLATAAAKHFGPISTILEKLALNMETLFCSNNATPMNTTNQLRGSQALHGTQFELVSLQHMNKEDSIYHQAITWDTN
ncbi:unnamed protein product [Cochlearia groenlandica]